MKQWLLIMLLLAAQTTMALRADINRDGHVDMADWAVLAEEWLMTDTYGPQLITNGDFSDISTWTLDGWNHSGGGDTVYAIYDLTPKTLSQSIAIEAGWTYRITFDCQTAGFISFSGFLGGQEFSYNNGSNSIEVTAGSTDTLLKFIATGPEWGPAFHVLDDVSVKLVIPEGALVTTDTVGTITVKFAVPLGHEPGDYCILYSNNGSGAIDWDSPFSTEQIPLFPNAAGNYGFGNSPFGAAPFGMPYGKNLRRGFGTCPFGMSPFGIGAVVVTRRAGVTECGDWIFGVKCYDKLGNEHVGTPNQVAAIVHVTPAVPAGLKKDSYDKATDILTLSVVDPYSQTPLGQPPSTPACRREHKMMKNKKLKFACPNHPDRVGIVTVGDRTPCWQCYLSNEQFEKRFGKDFYKETA